MAKYTLPNDSPHSLRLVLGNMPKGPVVLGDPNFFLGWWGVGGCRFFRSRGVGSKTSAWGDGGGNKDKKGRKSNILPPAEAIFLLPTTEFFRFDWGDGFSSGCPPHGPV